MLHSSLPELQYQIALTLAPAVGPITARKLIDKAGSARNIFHMSRGDLEGICGIGPQLSGSILSSPLLERAAKEIEFIERYRISALYMEDPDYPRRLKECKDAPIVIYTRGTKGLNARFALSVVGTRRASSYGRELCRKMVLDLSASIKDLVIVSGLAYGIDVMAHRAALEAEIPTIAVLGHGLQTIYPRAHRETAKKICDQGALLTDFPSGTGPERNNFLRRNRIIAGMADATLVIESAAEGGALITSDLASSYNRDVLAVPGRATDIRSRGCNRLIKDKVAAMVESVEDIMGELNWTDHQSPKEILPVRENILNHREKNVLILLNRYKQLRPEEISAYSGIPIQEVLSSLTALELKRFVHMEPGNLYQSSGKPC